MIWWRRDNLCTGPCVPGSSHQDLLRAASRADRAFVDRRRVGARSMPRAPLAPEGRTWRRTQRKWPSALGLLQQRSAPAPRSTALVVERAICTLRPRRRRWPFSSFATTPRARNRAALAAWTRARSQAASVLRSRRRLRPPRPPHRRRRIRFDTLQPHMRQMPPVAGATRKKDAIIFSN